jgi:putative SOS response-associated peptidase YedK
MAVPSLSVTRLHRHSGLGCDGRHETPLLSRSDVLLSPQKRAFPAPPDGSPALTVAGLWDEWHDKASGETLRSCTMIITEPNKFVAEVHDRMPVLLADKDYEPWLGGKAGLELLKPAAENALQKRPVSKRVNSSRASDDDATLIERITIA